MTALETEVEPTDNEWLPDTRLCPSWCDKAHAEALAEGNGWERSQIHHAAVGGSVLSEIRYADRAVRGWGGGWDLVIEQHPLRNGGYRGPALIVSHFSSPDPRAVVELNLTSGEARTLAAQLIAAADRIDRV